MKTKIISIVAGIFVVGIIVFINIFSFTPSAGYTVIDDEVLFIDKGNIVLKTGDISKVMLSNEFAAMNNPLFDVSDQFVTLYSDGKVLAFTPDSEESDVSSYDYKAPLIVTNINGKYSINDTYSNTSSMNIEELNGKNSFNKNDLGHNDVLLSQRENDYLLFYGSTLSIDGGAPIKLNPMINVVTTDNNLTVTELVDGELVVTNYPFVNDYEIIYGDLTIAKDSIMNSEAKYEKEALDKMAEDKKLEDLVNKANGIYYDKDGNLVDKDGNRIDKDGNLIDKDGNLIDSEGNRIDKNGNKLDENGNIISGGGGAAGSGGAGEAGGGSGANSNTSNADGTNGQNGGGSSNGGNSGNNGGKGEKDKKEPKPVIVYEKPKITNIEVISKDINPYEKILVKISVSNPDEFNIINILTEDMAFMVNEKVNGDIIIEIPPKRAGVYTINFTEMTVEKGMLELIPINKSITFEVYDTPYLRFASIANKDKSDKTSDVNLQFESGDPLVDLEVDSVVIEGKNYNNVEKVDNQNFIVHDVNTSTYDKSGKYNLPISTVNFTYGGKKHSTDQIQYNVAGGVVYKDVFDPNSIKMSGTVEYGQLVYNITVKDPDRSISKLQVDLYEASNDALVQSININGNASGNYKAVFKGVKAGVDLYAKVTFTYSKFDASMAQSLEHTDSKTLIVPFTIPSIKEVSFDRFVFDEEKFQITLILNNPDNFKIEEVTINGYTYSGANLLKSGDNVYRVQNIYFDPTLVGARNEKFTINQIKYTDPNGLPTTVTEGYTFEIAKLDTPRMYADDNGNQVLDMDFVPTSEPYKLQIKSTYDNKTTTNVVPLKAGPNNIVVPMTYQDGTVVKMEYSIITDKGFSQKINLKDADYFYSNNPNKMAYDDYNSFYLEKNGTISAYGRPDNGALNVPKGKKYDKILYEQGIGVAYSSADKSVTAWGRYAREINLQLAQYNGKVVGIDMAETTDPENYLIAVTLEDGTYGLIGNDNAGRISAAPQVKNVQKVIPGEFAVVVIDTNGVLHTGGSTSVSQTNLFRSIDYEYTSGKSKVVDASFGEGGMILYDRNKKVRYYHIGAGQPDFYPNSNATFNNAKYVPGTNGQPPVVTYSQTNGANGIVFPLGAKPSPYLVNKPDYIEKNDNPIYSIDVTGNTVMIKYLDGSFNYYGENVNNSMKINRIQHLPTPTSVAYQTYDGMEPLPGEMVKLSVNMDKNYDGLYVSQLVIKDSKGKLYTFNSGLAHGYNSAVINNVLLETQMGNNEYEVTSITYANRYNPAETKKQDLSKTPLKFSIRTSPGLKVNQSEGENFNITYGVINNDPKNTIELQYQESGTNTWVPVQTVPINKNSASVGVDLSGKYVKFRITVKNGRYEVGEAYETGYRVVFDHFTTSTSTISTFTQTNNGRNIVTKGLGSSPIAVNKKPTTKTEFTKVETYGDLGFALDLNKNLQVWGDATLSKEFNQKLAPYQGTIVDYQLVGIQGSYMPVPIVNIVLDNGQTQLIALDGYQPNWSMELANDKEMYLAAGDNDIIYFIDKDGNFGFIGANNDNGRHTTDPIPAFILNGTVKIKKIEYTPQAVYLLSNDNVLYVFRKNTTARQNACYLDKSGSTVSDIEGSGFNNSVIPSGYSYKKSSTVALKQGNTVSVCEINEDNTNKNDLPKFILPAYNFPYTKDVQVEALVNGFSYDNGTDYYYAGVNSETRLAINYLLTPATITTSPGSDFAIIDIAYQAPAVPLDYEIYNYDTGTQLLKSQVNVLSNERIYISGLKPETTYTFDITAKFEDASGNKKSNKINDQPIVFTTGKKDTTKFIPPRVLEYTYEPSKNDPTVFNIKLSVINENDIPLVVNPNITNGTIKKTKESKVGSLNMYEYTAYTSGMSQLSWQISLPYDWTKPMSYYGTTNVDYFNTVINPGGQLNGAAWEYVYFIYKSPLNGKYYPVQDISGIYEIMGSDRQNANNPILDENGVPVKGFNPANQYENVCYTLTYADVNTNKQGKFNINEAVGDKACSDKRPATANGNQYWGTYNGNNMLGRWNVNARGALAVENILQLSPTGEYVWAVSMTTSNKGRIDFSTDLVVDYSNGDKKNTPIRYGVTPNYSTTYPIQLYMYVPNFDNMEYGGMVPTVTIGDTKMEVSYPYGSRIDVYAQLPQISGVSKYKLYVNDGKDNTSLATAKRLDEIPKTSLSAGIPVDPKQDYTFIVTYDTDLESDIYLKHINANSYENEVRVSTWYQASPYGASPDYNYSLILMDDGTIVSSSPRMQALIDPIQDQGTRFTSVNRVIIDENGRKYSPYTMEVLPSTIECFYSNGIVKKSNGTYSYSDVTYGGSLYGEANGNKDGMASNLTRAMNNDKSTTSYNNVAFGLRWGQATQTDHDFIGPGDPWGGGPKTDMSHTTLTSSGDQASTWGYFVHKTTDKYEGQSVRAGYQGAREGDNYFITVDDKLVMNQKRIPSVYPAFIPKTDVKNISDYSLRNTLQAVEYNNGLIAIFDVYTGLPATNNFTKLDGTPANPAMMQMRMLKDDVNSYVHSKVFYTKLAYGFADINDELDPLQALEQYNENALIKALPFTKTTNDLLTDMGISEEMYYQYVAYDSMLDELVASGEVVDDELYKVLDDAEKYMELEDKTGEPYSFLQTGESSESNPYEYSDVTLNYLVENEFISEELATSTSSSIEKDVKMIEKKVEKESHKVIYYLTIGSLVLVFVITKKIKKQVS